ncbi:hemerythrin domain-containing protein [Sphingomonas xanthus]|nr:hemerythrin domain-containing protein [Sphingomonas xanthus]
MNTRSESRAKPGQDRSPFNFSGGSVIAAVAAGAALALAGNFGRKLAVQGLSASKGDWSESLAAEHTAVEKLFDAMLATDDGDKYKRALLLTQLSHALDKHAYAEEHVIYPKLRETGDESFAEHLENDHGAVKEFLYRLSKMSSEDPAWRETVGAFRNVVLLHAEEEEKQIFPALRAKLSDDDNARLTKDVNKAGFWAA